MIENYMSECEDNLYDREKFTAETYALLKEKYKNNACFLAAFIEDNFAGYAAFYCNDNISRIAYLSTIVVKEEYQGLGAGKALMNKMKSICEEKNFRKIRLEVNTNNIKAKNLYHKCGYVFEKCASEYTEYFYLPLKKN